MEIDGVILHRSMISIWRDLSKIDKANGLNFDELLVHSGLGGIGEEHLAEMSNKFKQENKARGLKEEPEYILVLETWDLPLWLSMTCNFNLGEKESILYDSPFRNFVWKLMDSVVEPVVSAFANLILPFCNSSALSWYYNEEKQETHSNLIKWFDKFDYKSMQWELVYFKYIKKFFQAIYKALFYVLLVPIRAILPAQIEMGWIIDKIFEQDYYMGDLLAPQHLDRAPLPRVGILLAVENHDLIERLSYEDFVEAVEYKEDEPISAIPYDTIEGQFVGSYTEYRQGFLATDEAIENLFNNDDVYGLDHQGFPWLSYSQRVFYLDMIFIPICISALLLLFLVFYYYNGEGLSWEWNNPKPEDDLFAKKWHRGFSKAKYRGQKLFASSCESFFVNKLECKITPTMYDLFQDTHNSGVRVRSLNDEQHFKGDILNHM